MLMDMTLIIAMTVLVDMSLSVNGTSRLDVECHAIGYLLPGNRYSITATIEASTQMARHGSGRSRLRRRWCVKTVCIDFLAMDSPGLS